MNEHRRTRTGHHGDDARFTRLDVSSDPADATHVRNEFGAWLKGHFELDETRYNDVLLAVYEALANAAEYAYVGAPGTIDFCATHAADTGHLGVTVADHGVWRTPEVPQTRFRGRGIPLMRALADNAAIAGTGHGTEVTLEWLRVRKRGA